MNEQLSYYESENERLNNEIAGLLGNIAETAAWIVEDEARDIDTGFLEALLKQQKLLLEKSTNEQKKVENKIKELKAEREAEWEADRQAKKEEARRRQEEEERSEEEERCRWEAENRRRKAEEQRRREKEEAKAERLRQKEEARRQAELAAKRKTQEEEFRKKMMGIQAQWQTGQAPVAQTSSHPTIVSSTVMSQQTTALCPQCGNSVSKTAKFCTNCGTKLSVTCPCCGASLKATAKFCSQCGTSIKNNNMSKKTTKTVMLGFYGYGREISLIDKDDNWIEGGDENRISADRNYNIIVDGKEYKQSKLGDIDDMNIDDEILSKFKDLDVLELAKAKGASKIELLYTEELDADIEIEIPEDEEFDPKKCAVIVREWTYPNGSTEDLIYAIVYDGKVYEVDDIGGCSENEPKSWTINEDGEIVDEDGDFWDDEEDEEGGDDNDDDDDDNDDDDDGDWDSIMKGWRSLCK